jgi:hypothetical protein
MEASVRNGYLLDDPFPVVVEKPVIYDQRGVLKKVDQYKALVDSRNGKVFSIVSRNYKLITHEEAIDRIEGILTGHEELGYYRTKTEFYNAGARMRRTYSFPRVDITIRQGDVVNLELQLFNSYDRTWPFIIILGGFRVVCSNGLVIRKTYYHCKKSHVSDLADIAPLNELSTSISRFITQGKRWMQWANIPLTGKVYGAIMESMKLGTRAVSAIHQEALRMNHSFERGIPNVSLWIFYNLLTWYITHRTASLIHRVKLENGLRIAMRHFKT